MHSTTVKTIFHDPRYLLIVVPILVYANSLFGDFVYDDRELTVLNNPALTGEATVWEILQWDRPVREFTYMLDHAIWGFNPLGYHLQNLIWHIANTLLLYTFLLLLGFDKSLTFGISLLFSIHPINTEAVSWISGRKELLCLFFELSASIFFIKAFQSKRIISWLYSVSILCCVLALLSKQVAVALPVFFALSLWIYRTNHAEKIPLRQNLLFLYIPCLLVMGFLLFRYPILEQLGFTRSQGTFYDPAAREVSYTILSAALTPFATFLKSLSLCLWPMDITIEHAYQPVTQISDFRWILGAVLLLAFCVCAFLKRKTTPGLLFGVIWFLAAWAPVSGLAPVAYMIADRYLYIPCAGFCIALLTASYPVLRSMDRKIPRFSITVGLLCCLLFSARTVVRNFDWRGDLPLWQSAVQARPENPLVYSGLANAFAETGDTDNAFKAWNKSLELNPGQPRVLVNIGNAEKRRENLTQAEQYYRKALELYPDYGAAHFNLALLLEQQGQTDAAIEHFQQAAKHLYHRINTNQRKGIAHYHIARLMFGKGDLQTAAYQAEFAEKLAPFYAPIYNLKGMLNQSNPLTARHNFEKAILYDPAYSEALFNLGVLEWQQGNQQKAEDLWAKTLAINPSLLTQIKKVKNNSINP